jgi:hypothetical protein
MNAAPKRPLERRLDWVALHMHYIVGAALVGGLAVLAVVGCTSVN